MAISTEDPTEKASATTELIVDDAPVQMEPVRTEEVHALLGSSGISGNEKSEIVPDQDAEEIPDTPEGAGKSENDTDKAVSAPESFPDLSDNPQVPATVTQPENTEQGYSVVNAELKNIQESLQDSLTNTRYISSKIDAVSNDTDRLAKQINSISINSELLTAEMESITSSANTKSVLSKTFLTISSAILALLVIFQIYMFISLAKTQRLQNAAGSSVLQNISSLNKKMAGYDKHLTMALEKPAQQDHAKPNPAEAVKAGHETQGNKEAASTNITPLAEKLNKLRNGLPERKLIRKETGDWFVFNNKKSEELISDVEVIEVLNQAYRRIGRSLSPTIPTPPNNALCILKPDGKGGTEVVMTKEFLP